MSAAIDPVDLLTIEIDANRTAAFSSEDGCTHLMGEWVGFSAESTTHKGSVDVDLVHRDIEDG